jgi:hypothetical protein
MRQINEKGHRQIRGRKESRGHPGEGKATCELPGITTKGFFTHLTHGMVPDFVDNNIHVPFVSLSLFIFALMSIITFLELYPFYVTHGYNAKHLLSVSKTWLSRNKNKSNKKIIH